MTLPMHPNAFDAIETIMSRSNDEASHEAYIPRLESPGQRYTSLSPSFFLSTIQTCHVLATEAANDHSVP